jgi:hypothetical protein
MKGVKITGILILTIGVGCLIFSSYIQSQIDAGKKKIENVQSSIDTGNKILSLSPKAKELGQSLSKPIQKKLDAGQETIDKYQTIATNLNIAGWLALPIGALLILYAFFWKKRS